MTPRIITAEEARVLRQKSEDGLATMFAAGASDTMTLAPRLVAHLCHTVEALHADVARLRSLVREAYREGFATSDEMGWHGDDSASETRWLASAARAALEVAP